MAPVTAAPLAGVNNFSDHPFALRLVEAKGLAKGGDLDGAEAALSASTLASAGTPEWDLEVHGKLLRMAGDLSAEGNNEGLVAQVAARCLKHLNAAALSAKDAPTKANAKAAAAFVYLRYNGDAVNALAYLRAAASINPTDPGIQRSLTRLQNADAKLRARVRATKS